MPAVFIARRICRSISALTSRAMKWHRKMASIRGMVLIQTGGVLDALEQVVAAFEIRLVAVGGEHLSAGHVLVVGDQRPAAVADRVVGDLGDVDVAGYLECLLLDPPAGGARPAGGRGLPVGTPRSSRARCSGPIWWRPRRRSRPWRRHARPRRCAAGTAGRRACRPGRLRWRGPPFRSGGRGWPRRGAACLSRGRTRSGTLPPTARAPRRQTTPGPGRRGGRPAHGAPRPSPAGGLAFQARNAASSLRLRGTTVMNRPPPRSMCRIASPQASLQSAT